MSTETAETASHETEEQPHSEQPHSDHPGDWQYIKVAIFLAVLTALEVFTYFESVHQLNDAVLYAVLVVLMVLKFAYVVLWFMHLKFDSRTLRRVFFFALGLAVVVYMSMLTSFQIWA